MENVKDQNLLKLLDGYKSEALDEGQEGLANVLSMAWVRINDHPIKDK